VRNPVPVAAMLALAVVAAPPVNPASAAEYAYCASGASILAGGCSYETLEQCRAFISGYGGHCFPNPRHASVTGAGERAPRQRR
jgi:hypothetical protein